MNRLYYGDCLTIMQEMPLGSVDLIYLDPPFNSRRDYNAIYKTETGKPLPDQIDAFCDTWTLDEERERAIRHMPVLMREAGVDDGVAEFWKIWCNALRKTQPGLLAYLSYMTERLLPMRNILKPTGSIYLHCDPTASHYIKVMMDGIFGHDNFRNQVVWCYERGGRSKRFFSWKHDVLLLYARDSSYTFNADAVRLPRKKTHMKTEIDEEGREWQIKADAKSGKIYRYAMDRGALCPDWWTGIQQLNRSEKERLGYATQKPVELLERIIAASSNPGDVVFDPFCGCATTIEAAHKLGRKWVGIDIAIHAIKRVAKVRLRDRLGLIEGTDFEIEGVPRNVEGARDLWERDKYHFQKWAVEQVDGFVTAKRGSDGGIDGRLYFDMPGEQTLQSMVLEVKGGANVGIGVVRDLRGVLEREDAPMAGLIVMDELGERKARNFRQEMAQAGDLDVNGAQYARMQMLTVSDIFEGKRFVTPSIARGRGEMAPSLPFDEFRGRRT